MHDMLHYVMRYSLWVLVLGSWLMAGSLGAESQRSFTLTKSHEPIQMRDMAWSIQPPVALESVSSDAQRCTFRLRSDDEALFVHVEVWQAREDASLNLTQLEIVLSPQLTKSQKQYRFSLNLSSQDSEAYEAQNPTLEVPFQEAWSVAQETLPKRSQYLFRFPFASFGLKTPDHGDVWGFNVMAQQGHATELKSWSGWLLPTVTSPKPQGTIAFE